MQTLTQTAQILLVFLLQDQGTVSYLLVFVPFVLFLELPLYFVTWLGIFRYITNDIYEMPFVAPSTPRVTCAITCYAEGKAVQNTVISLLEQTYPGHIEIIAMVDGVQKNQATYQALKELIPRISSYPRRSFIIILKIQRGGRVSSLNAGLSRASGEVFLALDGDTVFDNQMIYRSALHFQNDNVVAVTGPMRVRNAKKSLVTRLQSLEYMLSLQVGKLGLTKLNVINNIPGAFGIFRKSFLQQIGGWNTGTAEDLDLTLRIKQYQGRYPQLRFEYEPGAVSHTDAPETFSDFLKQRLRWDGDLWYTYAHKHKQGISASIMGWSNFIFILWYGILFQIIMPFTIVLYMIYMAITQPLPFFLASVVFVYLFYLCLTLVQFVLYLAVLSDRKWEDCKASLVLPIYPLFLFTARLWSAVALLNQMFNKGHLDSAMAPWWVLKKGKQ